MIPSEIVTQPSAPPGKGLSSQEAADRLSQYGPNDPTPIKGGAAVMELLVLFLNPLVIILLVASLVSFLLGDAADAGIILVIVLLSISINFFQTYQSQRAVEKLREHVTPTATILRDGEWREIKRQLIVPGDIVRLSAGDLVPADAKLLQSRDLYVQQGALTGESLPAEKEAQVRGNGTAEGPDRLALFFWGHRS
jgi:P-type Mg2+ transporter